MSKARELANLGNAYSDGALSNRNLIINGGMQVAQRGTSFTTPSNIYTLDRWFSTDNTGAAVTVTQDSDAPDGFTNSAKITVNAADTSLAVNSVCLLRQNIEGVNFSQCGFGSSQAKDITISFWVKSSITGQYSVALNNSAYDRSYVTGYTITSANTWEYKSVQISGDTSGTWLTSFSIGAAVHFPVAVEAGKITSGNAWTSGFNYGVTGQVNFVGTNNATFQITGVQLEVGDTATPFEHRSYGDELARCQRYFWSLNSGGSSYKYLAQGANYTNTACYSHIPLPTDMRAVPSLAVSSQTDFQVVENGSVKNATAVALSGSSTKHGVACLFSASVGQGNASLIRTAATANVYIHLDAEL